MDGETPSWLEESAAEAPAPEPAPTTEAPPSAFSIDDTPEPTSKTAPSAPQTDNVAGSILKSMNAKAEAADVDESDLPRMILFMRVANLVAAGLLIACSIVELVSIPGVGVWILSIYAICGGALICCLETQLKFVRTAIAMNFGFLINGATLTETVFTWRGLGRFIFDTLLRMDYTVIQTIFMIIAITAILANFIADLLYGVLDPRIKYG